MIKRKIKKILVPLDGSKSSLRGLDEAIYLARQCNATITGLHVMSIYPQKWRDLANPLKTRMFREAKELMDEAEVVSARNGIVFHKKLVYGDAKWSIAEILKDSRFDLVVIGARGLGQVRGLLLGSTSNAILHRAKTPVLVVK